MSAPSAPVSAVFKGVSFENRAAKSLRQHLSMSLRRVGGAGDGGIDLQGWWWLPQHCLRGIQDQGHAAGHDRPTAAAHAAVRVLAQCKAEKKKMGPAFIREFEGTILRYSAYLAAADANPSPVPQAPVVGLFASISPFTKASLLRAFSSPIPLALLHLPEPLSESLSSDSDDEVPAIGTLLFNPALCGDNGLLCGTVEPRWERAPHLPEGRPGLWCDGQRLESWLPDEDEGSRSAW